MRISAPLAQAAIITGDREGVCALWIAPKISCKLILQSWGPLRCQTLHSRGPADKPTGGKPPSLFYGSNQEQSALSPPGGKTQKSARIRRKKRWDPNILTAELTGEAVPALEIQQTRKEQTKKKIG